MNGSAADPRTMPADDSNSGSTDLFSTLVKAIYAAAGIVVLLWFLFQIKQVVMLFLLALVLALVLNVPVTWMEDKGLARGIGTLLVALVLTGVAGGVSWLVAPRVAAEIPRLLEELPRIGQHIVERVAAIFGDHPEIERQFARVVDWLIGSIGTVWQHADAVVGGFVLTLFVVALVLYLIANPRPLLETYVRAMPQRHREPAVRAFARSSTMVVGWVLSNAVLGGIKAVVSFFFLTFMDVPGAIFWSVLALFAGLIPRLGFYIMAIPPVLAALAEDPTNALWVALFYWALSEFLGNFVAPKIQGDLMDIHPVFVLFMTLALAYVFGVLGVILAPVVAGFVKVFFDEFYLKRQPDDPKLDERVDHILGQRPKIAKD
jgi:putative permease